MTVSNDLLNFSSHFGTEKWRGGRPWILGKTFPRKKKIKQKKKN